MYLLDANVFIEAQKRYYRFDTFPSFWIWLNDKQHKRQVASVWPIGEELLEGNDELASWAKKRKAGGWFLPVSDVQTQHKFSEISDWVNSRNFTDSAKKKFLGCADPWLVAKAAVLDAVVVTQEVSAPESRTSVKIPDVCFAFNVHYINTFTMMEQLGARFE